MIGLLNLINIDGSVMICSPLGWFIRALFMYHKNDSNPMKNDKGRLPAFLLIGTLSFFYAEIFSGASRVWFLDPWSLLITFPIYLTHIILLLNIAFRTGRTSLSHLYILGVVFGLYESWITQVLWYGYYGADEVTVFAGLAVFETIVLILFWHPLFSFIIPILVFQLLSCSFSSTDGGCDRVIDSHTALLVDTTRNRMLLLAVVLSGSVFMTFNYGGDLLTVCLALIGSYSIISILAWATRRMAGTYDLSILAVRRIWPVLLIVILSYVSFFYLSGLQGIFTDGVPRTPEVSGLMIILAIYIVIIGLFMFSSRSPDAYSRGVKLIPLSIYLGIAVLHLMFSLTLALIYMLSPVILTVLMFVFYMAMIPGGILCLILALRHMARNKTIDSG